MNKDIILENGQLRLTVGPDCIAKSLIHKASGQECLAAGEDIALFSVTQERPFNNEVKLAHPNKRTSFQANRIRREGDRLIIGFEITPFEAVVEVRETDEYIAFTLSDFIVHPTDYEGLRMSPPPVAEFRLLQLPVKNRRYFGEWLNVSWDESAAVNVLATSPYARIDAERRIGCRIMTADAVRGIKLRGTGAALIACPSDHLMDAIDVLECDFDLPRGVQSRRGEKLNASAYHSGDVTPDTVDEHIKYAKMGGFRMMLLYYSSIFKAHGYIFNGDYDYRDEYPNGAEDLKKMLEKIKAAGITPGLHFLHTHIGLKSRYVTPVADHRLNLTRRFTLARPLSADDTEVYVEQNPEDTVMADDCRLLMFGGELISYESYSVEPPYRFTGCVRGAWETTVREHPRGEIGGILDVSEFGATSVYVDQNTDLQEEVGRKLADAYNLGFRFVYFDGSEGTNAPFEFHVPNAQYRVWKLLDTPPLYSEGAAKAHFSWHFLSGGNAFDVFKPPIFKEMIARFPAEEAPRMRQDFTRLNFGWWGYWTPGESPDSEPGTQPDMLEYGSSRAAAWDCPATIITSLEKYAAHPRTPDNLEVIRRWEDVREQKWLTDEQKEMLKNLDQEHILLINEEKAFELLPYEQIEGAAGGDMRVRAFLFERRGLHCVVYWHTSGEGTLKLPALENATLRAELYEAALPFETDGENILLPIDSRRYLTTSLSREEVVSAFERAALV